MTNSLRSIEYGRWVIGSDPDATRIAYAELTRGSPEECGCDPCLNFAAQRNKIYSPRALALFELLAIQPDREAEIYHMTRLESGKHLYGAGFTSWAQLFRVLTLPNKFRKMFGGLILILNPKISVWDLRRA